jgi:hypothetical protein
MRVAQLSLNGKHLATVLRIKTLLRLRCCALSIGGAEEREHRATVRLCVRNSSMIKAEDTEVHACFVGRRSFFHRLSTGAPKSRNASSCGRKEETPEDRVVLEASTASRSSLLETRSKVPEYN